KPGVVMCKTRPTSTAIEFDMKKRNAVSAEVVWQEKKFLPSRPVNHEKICSLYDDVNKFVPSEYRNDKIHILPTAENKSKALQSKLRRFAKQNDTPSNEIGLVNHGE
ncbi:unnamed protein product, partial [Aphanomyces euteiches]